MGFLARSLPATDDICVGDQVVIRSVLDRDGAVTEEIVVGAIVIRICRRGAHVDKVLIHAPQDIRIRNVAARAPALRSASLRAAGRSWRNRPSQLDDHPVEPAKEAP